MLTFDVGLRLKAGKVMALIYLIMAPKLIQTFLIKHIDYLNPLANCVSEMQTWKARLRCHAEYRYGSIHLNWSFDRNLQINVAHFGLYESLQLNHVSLVCNGNWLQRTCNLIYTQNFRKRPSNTILPTRRRCHRQNLHHIHDLII